MGEQFEPAEESLQMGESEENTVASRASTLLDILLDEDIENQIPTLQSIVEDITNHELYDPETYNMGNLHRELASIAERAVGTRMMLEQLQHMEDTTDNREKFNHTESTYNDISFSFVNVGEYIAEAYEDLFSQLNQAMEQAMAEEEDVPIRELSIAETTLQRIEYTQQHIDQAKVKCSVCLEDFVLRDSLQQCPQCSQLFHEHCILGCLRSSCTCPLCRYDLDKYGVDNDNFHSSNDMTSDGDIVTNGITNNNVHEEEILNNSSNANGDVNGNVNGMVGPNRDTIMVTLITMSSHLLIRSIMGWLHF